MKIGDCVTYVSFGKKEHGIVKSLSDENHVFVVYHCAGNWGRYFDYTAARTEIGDLLPGWLEDCVVVQSGSEQRVNEWNKRKTAVVQYEDKFDKFIDGLKPVAEEVKPKEPAKVRPSRKILWFGKGNRE